MKRAALVAAILLSSLPATAQQLWQNQQNVNGFCAAPVGNATLLPLVQADGTIACLTPVTSSTVPIFNGTTVVWSTVPPSGITPGTVGQVLLTGVGPVVVWGNFSTGLTVASNVVTANLSTGIAGGQSVIGGTAATDTLTIKSTSATPTSGSRIYFQTAFTGDYYDPVVGTFGMSAGSTVLSMFKPGDQFLLKTVGNLTVGTNDAHSTIIRTNGANAIVADSSQGVTFPALAGGGTQCVQVDNTGKVGTTGSACGSGGLGGASGTVTNVTGTPPIFITGTPAATPNVTIQGAITSGSTSTSAQNIGVIATAPLACSTAAGVCTVTGMTVGGGLSFNASTAAETLGSFACGTHQFVNQSSTSGLACVQPAFTDLSGSASCGQTPAFSGDLSSAGGTCSVSVVGVESAATVKGYLATNAVVAPATPGVGVANIYIDSTSDNLCSKNSLGIIDHGIQSNAGLANKWVSAIADDGSVTLSQPAFSNLSGSATCAQQPALTGDTTSGPGSCATTTSALHDGGGVQHTTSGTWANSALMSTDGSGHIVTEAAATCSQMDGTFKIYDAGSCSGQAWTTNGTWSGGGTLITDTGLGGHKIDVIPSCNVNANCSAGGDLAGNYPNPTIPTKGKVLVTSSDATPDYLANKVESTGGSIAVTTTGSGSQLNLNIDMSQVRFFTQQWGDTHYDGESGNQILDNKQTIWLIANDQAHGGWFQTASPGTAVNTTLASSYQFVPTYPTGPGYATANIYVNFTYMGYGGTGTATVSAEIWAINGDPATSTNYTSLGGVTQNFNGSGQALNVSGSLSAIPAGQAIALAIYRRDTNASAFIQDPIASVLVTASNP